MESGAGGKGDGKGSNRTGTLVNSSAVLSIVGLIIEIFVGQSYAEDGASDMCGTLAKSLRVGMQRWEVEQITEYDGGINYGDVVLFRNFRTSEGKVCKVKLSFFREHDKTISRHDKLIKIIKYYTQFKYID